MVGRSGAGLDIVNSEPAQPAGPAGTEGEEGKKGRGRGGGGARNVLAVSIRETIPIKEPLRIAWLVISIPL